MPDKYYGNIQMLSSRPPEPPYRTTSPSVTYQDATYTDNAPTAQQPAVQQTASFQPTAQQPAVQQTASFQPASQQPASQQPAPPQRSSRQQQAKQPKQKSGAGKTFLFGFLGALCACALAIGGFVAWLNLSGQTIGGGTAATAVMGTSDPTVINAVDEGQSVSVAVAAKALPSVVAVYNYQDMSGYYGYGYGSASSSSDNLMPVGMGSGVVISSEGYIITNYHVVEDAEKLTITVDGQERDAEYVGGDKSSDIAVVKVSDTTGLVPADIGDSDSLLIGEWVMTIGAPLGLEQSVATGVVSATNRSTYLTNSDSSDYFGSSSATEYTYYPNMIQTDALINPGNSGGALVDADGKLIGINSMLASYSGDYAGVGFAIPINYAMGIAEDIIAGKTPTHAILGVSISQVNEQSAQRYNLPVSSGAYIAGITEGTGAADSDLQVGDIIVAINGTTVASTTDVTLAVREHNVGDTVTVTVNRNGEELDIDVVLSSDEVLTFSDTTTPQQPEGYGNGNGNGNGYGNGYGGGGFGEGEGDGMTDEELEELLYYLYMMGH